MAWSRRARSRPRATMRPRAERSIRPAPWRCATVRGGAARSKARLDGGRKSERREEPPADRGRQRGEMHPAQQRNKLFAHTIKYTIVLYTPGLSAGGVAPSEEHPLHPYLI